MTSLLLLVALAQTPPKVRIEYARTCYPACFQDLKTGEVMRGQLCCAGPWGPNHEKQCKQNAPVNTRLVECAQPNS
jgi:hypothetical protein